MLLNHAVVIARASTQEIKQYSTKQSSAPPKRGHQLPYMMGDKQNWGKVRESRNSNPLFNILLQCWEAVFVG